MAGLRHDRREHDFEIEGGADCAADLAQRLQLVDGPRQFARPRLQLLEQADVLDCDHRLVGEGLEEVDLLVRERLDLDPANQDRPDRLALAHEWCGQHGALVAAPDPRKLTVGLPTDVLDVNRPAFDDRASGVRATIHRNDFGRAEWYGAEARGDAHRVAIDQTDGCVGRVTDSGGVLGDRIHHRLQVRRRTGDHAQDLGHRGLLLERLAELARAFLDLALEPRVRLLELRSHAVELGAERLELIAGPHGNALIELPGADPRRARLQRLDRRDHPPGQDQARHHRQHDADDQQADRALDGGVEALERFLERLLDEDRPAQRRDRGVGGHHTAILEIARDRDLRPSVTWRLTTGQRRLHLLQLGERRLLQDEADVGMCDEDALAVDHEGMAGLADRDPRHDVPDELEVHLGDGDAGLFATPCHRDRHVGLGLLPKGHGPVIDLAGLGLDELRGARVVDAAAGDIHGQPRDAQLLLALRVQVADLGDRQHLAQEPQIVDAALVHGGRRRAELWLGRPADLLLDLLDERVDARGNPDRLLAL
jgi:hypothetical protein